MWTLFVVIIGVAYPIQLDGYTSKTWCERAGAEAVASLRTDTNGHGNSVAVWCTKDPYQQPGQQAYVR